MIIMNMKGIHVISMPHPRSIIHVIHLKDGGEKTVLYRRIAVSVERIMKLFLLESKLTKNV